MFISKHHYALELAKKGNTVFFLNPPEERLHKKVEVLKSGRHENLFVVKHRLWFPYKLRFHFPGGFEYLMKYHLKNVLSAINQDIDIIWSFDLNNLYPLFFFPKRSIKIFHPVDEPLTTNAIRSGKGAQLIFSVTSEILQKYTGNSAAKYLISHGIADVFIQPQKQRIAGPIRVGFSGNLLREDIDRDIFLRVVKENPEAVFECWGTYEVTSTNIGGVANSATVAFVDSLKRMNNVVLHGAVPFEELASELHRMDAFVICYDINKDQSKGTNYHKIMEYLATGKVVISNNVSAYANRPGLVEMLPQRDNNQQLPALFREVIDNLSHYNNEEKQEKRRRFAMDNTYKAQVDRIDNIMQATFADSKTTAIYQ